MCCCTSTRGRLHAPVLDVYAAEDEQAAPAVTIPALVVEYIVSASAVPSSCG